MNIEQWVMRKNHYLIHNNFSKKNQMIAKQLFLLLVSLFLFFSAHRNSFFVLEKETSSNNERPQRKPAVPSIRDAPKMGTRTEKNFVQTNALDVVMTVPKKPERNIVDDRFGDKFPIDPSGLTPKYMFKKVASFRPYQFFVYQLSFRILVKYRFI